MLSTVEESVRQSLFITSHQSQPECGENEVCVTFEIHCTEKGVVLENPLKKVLLRSSLQPLLCRYCIMTKFIVQNNVQCKLENKFLIPNEDVLVHNVDIIDGKYTGCLFLTGPPEFPSVMSQ